MKVVFDTNVVISAAWRGEAFVCLVRMARRLVTPYASQSVLAEFDATAKRLDGRKSFKDTKNPWPIFHWYADTVTIIEPAALGKQRIRGLKEDMFIACALAADARLLVTYDRDLLDLEKPFGVQIIKPADFLRRTRMNE
ncbi:MAG: putative toxin-antitoxin system toxin component, PIN family [Verrucomicrobiota bacterium]